MLLATTNWPLQATIHVENVSESFLKRCHQLCMFQSFPHSLPHSPTILQEGATPLSFVMICGVCMFMVGEGELCACGRHAYPHLCTWKPEVEVSLFLSLRPEVGSLTVPGPHRLARLGSTYHGFPMLITGTCRHALLFSWMLGF